MLTTATVLLLLFPLVDDAEPEVIPYAEIVAEDAPVAWWRFEETDAAASPAGDALRWQFETHGGVTRDGSGPQQPWFPAFAQSNSAIEIPKRAGWISISDPGDNSLLDFDLGDSITIEAWVAPEGLPNSQYG